MKDDTDSGKCFQKPYVSTFPKSILRYLTKYSPPNLRLLPNPRNPPNSRQSDPNKPP